jgi:hypothetical protein
VGQRLQDADCGVNTEVTVSDREWMDVDEASSRTGYSETYIEKLHEEGIIRGGENILGVLMVNVSDLMEFNREVVSHRDGRDVKSKV